MPKQEVLHTFDAETGQLDERILANYTEEQITNKMEEAIQVKQMVDTKGWQLIQSRLFDIIEGCTQKLIDLDDINQIRKVQSLIHAYSNVIGMVQHTIAEGEHLSSLKDGM